MKSSIGITTNLIMFAARILDAIAFGTVKQPDGLFGVAA